MAFLNAIPRVGMLSPVGFNASLESLVANNGDFIKASLPRIPKIVRLVNKKNIVSKAILPTVDVFSMLKVSLLTNMASTAKMFSSQSPVCR
jgi:hypothetical protein